MKALKVMPFTVIVRRNSTGAASESRCTLTIVSPRLIGAEPYPQRPGEAGKHNK